MLINIFLFRCVYMLHEASMNTHTPKTRARNSIKFCPQVRYMFINAFKSVPFSGSIWKTTFLKIFVNVGPRILRNKTYIIVSKPKKTLSRQTLKCSYWHFKVLGTKKLGQTTYPSIPCLYWRPTSPMTEQCV